MIELLDRSTGSVVGIRVADKITAEEYQPVADELQRIIDEHGELSLFCRFDGLTGVEAEALWEDLKFYIANVGAIRRCAVVQDQDWQGQLAQLGIPFGIDIRVFDPPEEEEAWEWLRREVEAEAAPADERDARRARAVEQRLERLVKDLRANAEQGQDPHVSALFETSAEVLTGLQKAFKHYEKKSEPAWHE